MRLFAYLLISCLFLSSCSDDFFSTTLAIDPPDFQDLMVVNMVASNQYDELNCRVSRTFPVLENLDEYETFLHDANVHFYQNNQEIATFVNDTSQGEAYNYSGELSMDLVEGETYELRVDHTDYGLLKSYQTMPFLVAIENIEITENGRTDLDGQEFSDLEIKIKDPAGIQNFYGCQVIILDTASQFFNLINLYSEDQQVVDGFDYSDIYLSDQIFDGKEYTINLQFDRDSYEVVKRWGFLVWKSVTKDFYQYTTSLRKSNDGDDFEGFSEPTIIHSNIEGGLGCFGLINADLVELPR